MHEWANADKIFDVVAPETIEHFDKQEDQQYLKEISRVLKNYMLFYGEKL